MYKRWISSERGGSKTGCTLVIFLWLVVGYLSYRIVPVYLEKDAYHDELLSIAGRATLAQWNDQRITLRVIEAGRGKNFEVSRANIRIERVRGRPEVVLIVNYRRVEKFPGGYIYEFNFRSTAQGSLGF